VNTSLLILQEVLKRDIGEGMYFVTGDLSPEVRLHSSRLAGCFKLWLCIFAWIFIGGPM